MKTKSENLMYVIHDDISISNLTNLKEIFVTWKMHKFGRFFPVILFQNKLQSHVSWLRICGERIREAFWLR